MKIWSREIGCYNDHITAKWDRHLGSAAAELPVKFRLERSKRKSRGFETSRDLAVRRPPAWWIEARQCCDISSDIWRISPRGRFYWCGSTLIPAWINNHMSSKMWDYLSIPKFQRCNQGRGLAELLLTAIWLIVIHYSDVIMSEMVSNHRRLDCLLNRLFGRGSKKTSKLRVTGLCEGNSPVTGEFPTQKASNAENVSI